MVRNRVLIVQDDPATRSALGSAFSRGGWHVTEAADSAEAILALDAPDPPPDWMILDLRLPDDDGEFVLRKVRSTRLPVRVALCAGADDPRRDTAVASLQPDLVVRNPIDPGALLQACIRIPA
jgi:CheY-like chemotaxis protein